MDDLMAKNTDQFEKMCDPKKVGEHAAYANRLALAEKGAPPAVEITLASHAPWLNGDAIAYRRGIGAPTKNGFYWG
jgi:hypothetical protein